MKKRKKMIVVLVILLLVAVAGYAWFKGKAGEQISVNVTTVTREPMIVKVFATGRIKTVEEANLFAPFSGIVREVLVEPGDNVAEGQVLVRFVTDDLARKVREAEARLLVEEANLKKAQAGAREEELVKARARLEQAEKALETAKDKLATTEKLYEAGAVTAEELEKVKQELASSEFSLLTAQKDLEILAEGERPEVLEALEAQKREAENSLLILQEQLEQGEVKSPMSGTVLDVMVDGGQMINQGGPLLTVGDLSSLKVEVNIGEGDSKELAVGQPVEITGTSFEDTYEGKVTKIAPAGKLVSGNQPQTVIPVEIVIEGSPPIRPGVSADVKIVTVNHPKAILVPYEAVVEDEEEQKVVFVVKDGKVEKRVVTLGVGNELYREVLSGLAEGEEIVLNPPSELEDGAEVTILPKTNGMGR